MERNRAKAKAAIKAAIIAVEKEIKKDIPESGPKSRLQLQKILNILCLMEQVLNGEQVHTPQEIYGYGLGQVITDSWPDNDKLGEIILTAEHLYTRAMHNFSSQTMKKAGKENRL